jgi:hypothetical protein
LHLRHLRPEVFDFVGRPDDGFYEPGRLQTRGPGFCRQQDGGGRLHHRPESLRQTDSLLEGVGAFCCPKPGGLEGGFVHASGERSQ